MFYFIKNKAWASVRIHSSNWGIHLFFVCTVRKSLPFVSMAFIFYYTRKSLIETWRKEIRFSVSIKVSRGLCWFEIDEHESDVFIGAIYLKCIQNLVKHVRWTFEPLALHKCSILDVSMGSEYASFHYENIFAEELDSLLSACFYRIVVILHH